MSNHTFSSKDREKIVSILGKRTYSNKVYNFMFSKGLIESNNVSSVRSYIRQVVNGLVNSKLYHENISDLVIQEEKKITKRKQQFNKLSA